MNNFSRWINSQNPPKQYKPGLELQVMVSADEGERSGKGYTDGENHWFNFRLPSSKIKDLTPEFIKHIEAVGMTGWDYHNKISHWVGFDFDSIVGHKQGLTETQLNEIVEKAKQVPWVEIRKSTSGKGLHFYVQIENCPPVPTRAVHILLARCILSNLSGLLNFDFKSKVDGCGGVLWVWHRKANQPESFSIVKSSDSCFDGSSLDLDAGKDEVEFKKKVKDLTATLKYIELSPDHQKLLTFLTEKKLNWWWDAELNMLVTHTHHLAIAHQELKLKGLYFTDSEGKGGPSDRNCFAFPMRNGAWIVRRYHPNTKEHSFWKTDRSGWTYCYYNRIPSLDDIYTVFNGEIDSGGKYVFPNITAIRKVLEHIAPTIVITVPKFAEQRTYRIKKLKDSKIAITTDRIEGEEVFKGWIAQKKTWEKVVQIIEEEVEITIPDNVVRHVISNQTDAGWYLCSNNWVKEPRANIPAALLSLNYPPPIIQEIIGQCVLKPWRLVVKPFQPEYPGNREWNKFAPQLMYEPKEGPINQWMELLKHLGKNLNDAVKKNSWCVAYNILTGAEYLKYWIASLFKYPHEPLPYLFFFGPQQCGKSTFHEALSLLVNSGINKADVSLTNPQRFNAELKGSILCIVEETNLRTAKGAYERIKEWSTGKTISIHEKGLTPIDIENTTHWIQCANDPSHCPISIGDTRICLIRVDALGFNTPKLKLLESLKQEAAAFLYEILNLDIPQPIDRLRIPLLITDEKIEEQTASANPVEQFIINECKIVGGHCVTFSDFMSHFLMWLQNNYPAEVGKWSAIRIGRAIPLTANMPIKGRYLGDGNKYLGNISFDKNAVEKGLFIQDGERIKLKEQE